MLATTVLGSSLAFVDGTVVNLALPALQRELGATVADVQWVVTEYGAVDLCVLSDAERPRALIALAHPDFRESLRAAAQG